MKAFKVAQVNEYIAKKLREDLNLRGLPVEGEVSGFSRSGAHFYFTLKDADSMIKCAIWGSNARNIDMKLVENGKKIVVIGDISPYPKGGNYSLSVRHVEAAGEGDLAAEFNRIKEMLEKEGLFKPEHKKPIPAFPYRVGIVTSDTGAAIEDIKKIITSKNNFTDILIFPTQVQGIAAPASICDNIRLANSLADKGLRIDTLIVGRGGGSAEDLAAFNDENVARTIFASKIPIISAVGHESDFSISDFVADVRAETPTAAADMAVMNTHELHDEIANNKQYLLDAIRLKIHAERELLESRSDLLYSNMKTKILDARSSLDKALITLRENNPQNIFNKGYAAVIDADGMIIPSIDKVSENENIRVRMKDGSFTAEVKSVERS